MAQVVSHVLLIGVSAGLAMSLPKIVRFVAAHLLVYWSLVENEETFLLSIEVLVAIGLIVLGRHFLLTWRDRRLALIATSAGIIECATPKRPRARRCNRRLKERYGRGRDVMILGCTGFRTFVEPTGELHDVLQRCRSARIMLLNPYGAGAQARARSLRLPEVTPERFEAQVQASVELLRQLRAAHRDVRLKLYDEPPLLKLAVLGDRIWLKHYHPGLSADALPEYVIENKQGSGELYPVFYEYFMSRWDDASVPEVDLDAEDLILREATRCT